MSIDNTHVIQIDARDLNYVRIANRVRDQVSCVIARLTYVHSAYQESHVERTYTHVPRVARPCIRTYTHVY